MLLLLLLTNFIILLRFESVDSFVTYPFLLESNEFDDAFVNSYLLGSNVFATPF